MTLPSRQLETRVAKRQQPSVQKEVGQLLSKGAIERAPLDAGFYSRIFLVPKKNGQKRPIINLKPLNCFLKKRQFRQATINNVCKILRRRDWAVSLDLTDAYFHVPVHTRHRRFLRFLWRGQCYQFRCLPFGLLASPRIFRLLLRPLQHICRSRGIRVIFYLDDLLILGRSPSKAARQRDYVVNWLQNLGFTLNWPKCKLSPDQIFQYLGLIWNTQSLTVCLTEEKQRDIQQMASELLQAKSLTARRIMQFLGKTVFASIAVPLARLHRRQLQAVLLREYRHPRDLYKVIKLNAASRDQLRWWCHLTVIQKPLQVARKA